MNFTTMAAELVMQDLIDCLLAEDFFGREPLPLLTASQWRQAHPEAPALEAPTLEGADGQQRIWEWCCDAQEQRFISIALRPGITQQWEKVPGTQVLARQEQRWTALGPVDFMRRVFTGMGPRFQDNEKGLTLFLEVLHISVWQTALSLEHRVDHQGLMAQDGATFFRTMEQWASLRDRPYHPLAKAKQGLLQAEYQQYQAEFAQPVALNWVAVRKDLLQGGEGVADLEQVYPARYLLPETLQERLAAELRERGIGDSHVALPVHPWQFEHVLPAQLGDAFARGDCQRLDFSEATVFATSSLRSMTPCFASVDYLKLPMAIYSLGASRYLPAVKMINGGLSEALLHQVRRLDPVLEQSLHLCDESKWWAFMPPQATLFDEAPRHLSAMVRGYPQALLDDPDCRLLPMAALGTPLPGSNRHFFDEWMQYRELPATQASVLTLFGELCQRFFDVNLRMFRLGMLGEVHGQNAVLVWKAGQAQGLLLRDHDSLRIFVPWLERNGMADPEYRIKKGHANTLYHQRPEDLLFWLQTLAIQVNVRAIIDTLAQVYAVPATELWSTLRQVLDALLQSIDFDDEARAMIKRQLFEAPRWPQKLLLTPMIERAGGPGSMPFGKGEVVNPFQRLASDA
ncbi:IucA/IucC family protein [Pseudomonas chlororaphis]|uniref:IucA/IucC family protein n=1 Tax=Pseudomonas chlororaphis TaxID=587753 RepID=UPI000E0B2BE5|nr:IucA/IucC family protein [Pseudomonas chlororaphis]AZD16040.1 Achromobactin biosynthesis protein AcsA, Siderophore synthetase superfamily [Pseudomonas chlororaphis]WDH44713.1 IucA/IucC family protein [Pseudomonas chlororaphis]WDH56560.1 IucA/IucC family protein [Pseudomonas chlororaphis]WQE15819.1 IucA/IucC family protein [Pseudomonas chlororaphis]